MTCFKYGKTEIDFLKKADAALEKIIDRVGFIERSVASDPFFGLVSGIIGQQISSKAANTVIKRLMDMVGKITPDSIAKAENLNSAGIPKRKVEYIKSITFAVLNSNFALSFDGLPDDEIIKRLTSLPGIGKWSAEMFMIFSLQRKNVLSWGDYGIRKGISLLYGERKFDSATFNLYKDRYSPYASIASFYLWKVAAGA
ncbi:MAG: hypothetical protein LBI30_02925 [Holosporales bacterium]|jgi:DNA-3-methyladenine glycosylase II|nr:hypothetical protein [Holosporales bacterium]